MRKGLTIKICVDLIVNFGPGTEVDELDFVGSGVDQDVLVLDVAMNDAGRVNLIDRCDDLCEDVFGQLFLDGAGVGDIIEEVFARTGAGGRCAHSLHDDHVAVGQFEIVNQPDDTGNVSDLLHESNFDRNKPFPITLCVRRKQD